MNKTNEIKEIVAERLRSYRIEAGLTQEQLAERADMHNTYIGQVERGEKNITIQSLGKILDALDISFSQFFEVVGNERKGENIPRLCYELVNARPKEEQRVIYEILKSIDKLSGRR